MAWWWRCANETTQGFSETYNIYIYYVARFGGGGVLVIVNDKDNIYIGIESALKT